MNTIQNENLTRTAFIKKYKFFNEPLLNNLISRNRNSLYFNGAIAKQGCKDIIRTKLFIEWLVSKNINPDNALAEVKGSILKNKFKGTGSNFAKNVFQLDTFLRIDQGRTINHHNRRTSKEMALDNTDLPQDQDIYGTSPVVDDLMKSKLTERDEAYKKVKESTPEVRIEEVGEDHPMKELFERIAKDIISKIEEDDEDPEVVVIESDSKGQFEHQIEEALANDWKFQGELIVTTKGLFKTKSIYTQLMVK